MLPIPCQKTFFFPSCSDQGKSTQAPSLMSLMMRNSLATSARLRKEPYAKTSDASPTCFFVTCSSSTRPAMVGFSSKLPALYYYFFFFPVSVLEHSFENGVMLGICYSSGRGKEWGWGGLCTVSVVLPTIFCDARFSSQSSYLPFFTCVHVYFLPKWFLKNFFFFLWIAFFLFIPKFQPTFQVQVYRNQPWCLPDANLMHNGVTLVGGCRILLLSVTACWCLQKESFVYRVIW